MKSSKTRRIAAAIAGLALATATMSAFVTPTANNWHHSGVVVAGASPIK